VALVQGLFFLALAPWAGLRPGFGGFVAAVGMMALTAFALTSAGVLLAWRFESVQGFHGVINLVLMPLWILSGSVFRADRSNAWVGTVERLNPLSYGVSGMRRALAGEGPPLGLSAGLMAGFGLLVFLGGVAGATRSPRR
jgi:ABC-2 type transport system permease protein